MTAERVRRAAAQAAVAASKKTGRPVHPAVATLATAEGVCHDPQHGLMADCPMCGVAALRERIASAALSVMVGSPHIANGKVSDVAWDVAGAVIERLNYDRGGTQ